MRIMMLVGFLVASCPVWAQAELVLSQLQDVSPRNLTEVNGVFFFSAYDTVNGSSLWKSDGTRSGTTVVKKFSTGTDKKVPQGLLDVGGTLYFCAYEEASGWELWKSNGTGAGTTMVKDICPGSSDGVSGNSCHLASIGSTVFFGGIDAVNGAALWKTGGSAVNTVMVDDINPVVGSGPPEYLFVMNNTLFFVGNDGETGDEWWKCEGPAYDTTTMVKDIWTAFRTGGIAVDSSRVPVILNGYFYFQGNEGTNGYELWRSDGTDAGTTLVKNINETAYVINGPGSSFPCYFTVVNGTLFFRAQDDSVGRELWKSDGTPGNATLVKDIYPGTDLNFEPYGLTEVNGTLYFSADNGTHGAELWKSDGSFGGTIMVKDINSGSNSSWPRDFIAFQGDVYFSAENVTNGTELWKTNGTVGNATLEKDIAPGSDSSWPGAFLVMNDVLFFGATYNNSVPEGEGDALFRYGTALQREFSWPMFLPGIVKPR